MILISIIVFSVISKDTSSKVTYFPWIQERRKIHSVQINPGNSQRKRHWIHAWWERKKKWGRKLFYLLLETRMLPGQIKPKGRHIQVTNSQNAFPRITWKKRQVLVKVLEALRDGQACREVCRDWAKCLKMCNSTFHFRVWRLLPSWWLGGGEMGAGSAAEAEPLPGVLSTCTAPTAGLPLRAPTPPPTCQRFPGGWSPLFPQTWAPAWPHSWGQAGQRWQNPEGDERGRARRNKHFK